MTNLVVSVNYDYLNPVPGTYPTIKAAIDAAIFGDLITLGPNYGPEIVSIIKNGITISGTSSSLGIELFVADGVSGLTVLGDAQINITDSSIGDIITGNDGDNVITVTGGIDIVDGGLGDDRLVVDYGSTAAVVTASTASIVGDLGTVGITSFEHYTILTGSGADILTFTTAHGNNYIDAGEGANTIVVGNGTNTVLTGSGVDTITAGNGDNYIDAGVGTIGANTIAIGSGNNTIIGSDGIDKITAGGGDNWIEAGDGANVITIGPTFAGDNVIIAGSGIDTITVVSGSNYIDAGVGTAGANTITVGPTGFGNNRIIAGDGIDTITTGNGDNCIDAGSVGANTIAAGYGNSVIIAGTGIDTITVGSGDNYIEAGSVGANTITAGAGNNYIIGGSGIDTITAMGGNNYIDAGSAANTVTTGLGHDIIITGDGIDTITSGDGNDIIINVGAGADVITAGGGHDRLISDFSTSTAAVNTAITGAESYGGTVGTATISGVEEFHITGGSGNDNIVTGDGADVLDGGAGADNLSSGRGSDVIYGGVGDTVSGGEDLVGDDFDVLVLKDFGPYEIVRDVLNAENGTIYQLDALGARVIGAEVIFTNIEHIEFVDPTVTTLEDTALTGNLFTTVATFTVGSTTYVAGQTAERTEGDLTINLDGSYIFSKRPAPPPCRA